MALATALLLGGGTVGPAAGPAQASSGVSTAMGIDGCGFTADSAEAFYQGSPYYLFGLYIGGAQASCPVTGSFAGTLQTQGWLFMPIWVGPQSSCWGGGGSEFSITASTAFSQGEAEETKAYNTIVGWGWDANQTPLIYDLEAYNTTSSCVAAAQNFISGWVTQSKVGVAQKAGVYGSTCGSDLQAYGRHSPLPRLHRRRVVGRRQEHGVAALRVVGLLDRPAAFQAVHGRPQRDLERLHRDGRQRLRQRSDVPFGPHREPGVRMNTVMSRTPGTGPGTTGVRRILWGAVIGASVVLASAAVANSAQTPGRPADPMGATLVADGTPPLDAALVTPGFGWVLTREQLLVTADGGATFKDTQAPIQSGTFRGAFFADPRHGVAAAAAGGSLVLARTADGGATWATSRLADPAMPAGLGYSSLSIAFSDPDHGAVLARLATGPNFSLGTLFSTSDGGATWTARHAPVAGRISVTAGGRTWLAGGVQDDRLFQSADDGASWTPAQLAPLAGRQVAAVDLPGADGLPVTVLDGGRTELETLTTADDGRHWKVADSVPVAGRTALGVRVPVLHGAAGPLVLDTAGGHAYRAGSGADIRPRGLPQGADTVTVSSDGRTGWALAVYGRCAHGKQDCTLSHDLVQTDDGGASWHRVHVWTEARG